MESYRKSTPYKPVIEIIVSRQTGLALVPIIVLALWLTPTAPAQSGSAQTTQAPAQTQTQSQTPAQASSQASSQAAPTDSAAQPQSLAEAARQANAQKDKPKAKHVYTDDNLSSIHGTISVVGDGSSRGSSGNGDSSEGSAAATAPAAGGNNSEAYWRSRARAIKDQITSTDQQIADVKAEIAKSGAASFDPSSGLNQNVIIVHDRNAEVKQLEDRKRGLENQLDELADDARKAGADSGWVR